MVTRAEAEEISRAYEYGGMHYAPEALQLVTLLSDQLRRELLDGAIAVAKREGRTMVTADDVRRARDEPAKREDAG